jgi:uncharacterized membrane protein YccC
MARKVRGRDRDVVERAEAVQRTVKQVCQALRAGAGYSDVADDIEQVRWDLERLRVRLWQRELISTIGDDPRLAA